uniref:Uncharacterized protein n=1 Tax=Arundo donax TaxID=35708 RepID=A0A0A9AI95_ARUDO
MRRQQNKHLPDLLITRSILG